jgi:hypothetical protein
MENTPLTVEKFTEAMRVFGDRMDARFDSMDKKFEERFKGVDDKFNGINGKFEEMGKRIDLCATKEQFKLLESGISEVKGKLATMENNMKSFVVRDELPEDIVSRLKVRPRGVFVVRDEDSEHGKN